MEQFSKTFWIKNFKNKKNYWQIASKFDRSINRRAKQR